MFTPALSIRAKGALDRAGILMLGAIKPFLDQLAMMLVREFSCWRVTTQVTHECWLPAEVHNLTLRGVFLMFSRGYCNCFIWSG